MRRNFGGVVFWFPMACGRPLRAIVGVDVALNVPGGDVVPQPVLENLPYKLLLIYGVQNDSRGYSEMPAARRNFASVDFHFFFFLAIFSGSFFMLGVSFAQRLATSGSRAKRYRLCALERNGMGPFLIILLELAMKNDNRKPV